MRDPTLSYHRIRLLNFNINAKQWPPLSECNLNDGASVSMASPSNDSNNSWTKITLTTNLGNWLDLLSPDLVAWYQLGVTKYSQIHRLT